jgi:signal transduction histidine kinase
MDKVNFVKKCIIGAAGYAAYSLIRANIEGDFGGVQIARTFLYAIFLIGIIALYEGIKKSIIYMRKKESYDSNKIAKLSINEMHEKKLNRELAEQNLLIEQNARLVERENISRNIHNSVGHSITAAIMTLDAADMLYEVKPDEARKRMNDANERMRGSLESIRRAVRALDDTGAPLEITDLISNFDTIIENFVMDSRIKVDKVYKTENVGSKISHENAEFLTGALEEFLTNGLKHGGANEYYVLLEGDSAHIRLVVKDNGENDFNEANREIKIKNGFGLKKIEQYVKRYGGKCSFENEGGFRSIVELPLIREGSVNEQ